MVTLLFPRCHTSLMKALCVLHYPQILYDDRGLKLDNILTISTQIQTRQRVNVDIRQHKC